MVQPSRGRRFAAGVRKRPGIVAIVVVALVVVGGIGTAVLSRHTDTTSTAAQERGMTSGQPLQQPPDATGMTITLDATAATYQLAGRTVRGNEYNAGAVAPTLRVQPGSSVTLTLVNHLPVATNLHFHGLHIAPTGDSDDPEVCVDPGGTHVYKLVLPPSHPQGTYWYHSHAMGTTCPGPGHSPSMPGMSMPGMSVPAPAAFSPGNVENQIFAGLSGALIVGDDRTGLPEPLRQITAQTLVFKDVQLDPAGRIAQGDDKNQLQSGAPTVRLVNGQLRPVLTMRPGETQLWRLVNAGADIFYDLRLAGYTLTVIGEDGIPVAATATPDTILMSPAKRFDVLVTAPARPGETWLETLPYSNGPQGDSYPQANLVQVRTVGDAVPPGPVVSGGMPGAPADLGNAPIAWRRGLQLSENDAGTSFFINNKQFDMSGSIFTSPAHLGTVEEWTLTNVAGEDHPFHLHTSAFQVMSINGVAQPFTHRQDTVLVPHQEKDTPGKVVIRIPFDDYPGHWMFHCHIAAHEDNGMMSYVDVVK